MSFGRIDHVAPGSNCALGGGGGSGSTARGDPAGRSHAPGAHGAELRADRAAGLDAEAAGVFDIAAREKTGPWRDLCLHGAARDRRGGGRFFASPYEDTGRISGGGGGFG